MFKVFFRSFVCAMLFVAGASVFTGCMKELDPVDDGNTAGDGVSISKYAVVVADNEDRRDLGAESDWLGRNGSLSFLLPIHLPDRHPELFENIPSGIRVTRASHVYVTCVGTSASYNNVLGYYTYREDKLTGDTDADRAYILDQIYNSTKDGVNLKQVVYAKTEGLEFGTTYRLDNDNQMFEAGTIIGFYLLPNSGGSKPKVTIVDGRPQFIATEPSVNTTPEMPQGGKVSHIMGQSACGDMVIAFEDLNSLYSCESDEDYNDLIFVVGDNLESRVTSSIEPYSTTGKVSFELLGSNCVTCLDASDDLGSLVNMVTQKSSKWVYEPLLQPGYNTGYFPVTDKTPLYAKIAFADALWYNNIGWFEYTDGMTFDDLKAQITDSEGNTKEDHLIFKNVTVLRNSDEFVRLGGADKVFAKGTKIAFFIQTFYTARTTFPFLLAENEIGQAIRSTTIRANTRQAQFILKASCDNVLVAFEDDFKGDEDFNDLIFHVSDNNASTAIRTQNIDNANFFPLTELNERYKGL